MPSKKSAPNQAIGNAMRAIRKEIGLTQEDFAFKAVLDRSYYGAIERGEFNITIDTLMSIAKGLDVSASEILKRAEL
jgi:transcriptional regulator with XRE-family HTH domain